MFCIWETSRGWRFTDCFFRNHQVTHGPYPTKEYAIEVAYQMMAWHGFKCMWT